MTVRVFWTVPTEVPAGAVELLDARERDRLGALRRPADRQRFLAAHALLRVVLGEVSGTDPAALCFVHRCATCGGPHGKPALAAGPQFSISHAGDRVVVAVAAVPVGVDVEVPVPGLEPAEFAAVAMSAAERAALADVPAADRSDATLRTWVRKEAVLKATGRGLAVPPDRIEISPAGTAPALVAWTADHPPADVAIADLDLGPGCHAAVAVLAPGPLEVMIHRAAGVTFAPVAAG